MNKNVETFIGCDNNYDESKIVIFGAPFDSTTSFRPGTRFASKVMRSESFGIETYSIYQDRDLEDICIFDGGDLELSFGNPENALTDIENFTAKLINDNKIPCMIGGEHLVTLGAFRAISKKYPDIHVMHFDAHADLRDEYLGQKLSHATVMHRIWDIIGDNRIFQFGIRSGEKSEIYWGQNHVFTNKFNFHRLEQITNELKGKPVYFTLDLDVLDPSVFPGTGTPEAGGVTFMELLKAILDVSKLNIVGMDINELCPIYDQSGSSTALACKVLRELLLSIY
ncbi:agmatinase [Clostridium botulinum]|uniref:Agmatinase n=1 Tax=Clostridium botulinum TaxID=1491 RepID=A0A6B4JN93_CLOBO|nr:agmatinase [Clostridium botulinum]EES48642.1 agmatinase [Clostridium botulinum E1 str. 'BoNT E Beluga']MBY6761482.1 agmatinase [Clostridium botulinum]MBY6920186.1 agmatinase [Clostridium botulinum]MCR1131077.1 agmatinase [Clostridium botulinum]NFH68571.1 agmatinase [Clostridium botulinum]